MEDWRPLARDDLEIAARMVDYETVYFVGDPIRIEYHQLDEMQYAVFMMLDGEHTIPEICEQLDEAYDLEVDPEELTEFIEGLQELNLLDVSSDQRVESKDQRELAHVILDRFRRDGVYFRRAGRSELGVERRELSDEFIEFARALDLLDQGYVSDAARAFREIVERNPENKRALYVLRVIAEAHIGKGENKESILFWRFPLTNPDRALGRLYRVVGPIFFRRWIFYAWAALFLVAVTTFASNLDSFERDLERFVSFTWLFEDPLFLLVLYPLGVLTVAGHETCHGLTVKHFGGRVREAGLLFAYLSGTAYCDISATYLFPSRWKRAVVSLAGPMWDGFITCIAILVYQVTTLDSYLGLWAFITTWAYGLTFLSGLNPLLRGDSYYALSDLLDYPNLRPDALSYFKLRALQLLLGRDLVAIPEEYEQRRRLFIAYALPGVVVTSAIVFGAALPMMLAIVRALHLVGVLIVVFFLSSTLLPLLVKLVRLAWQHRETLWASRRFRVVSIAAIVALVAAPALPWPLDLESELVVISRHAPIRAPAPGVISEVHVRDGERVSAGQLLISLDDSQARAALARAESELERAQADLAILARGARDEELAQVRAELNRAMNSWRHEQVRAATFRNLSRQGLTGRDDYDASRSARAAARTAANVAARKLELLSAGATQEEFVAKRAVVEAREAERIEAERRLLALQIRATHDGAVAFAPGDTPTLLLDRVVNRGDELVRIAEPELTGELTFAITQPVELLTPGAQVRAKLRGMPHATLRGEVLTVAGTVEQGFGGASRQVLRAQARLDRADLARWSLDMGGRAEIDAGWHSVGSLLFSYLTRLVVIDLQQLI